MDIEAVRAYCLALPFVEESLPFDPETLVFKVKGKMFLLASLDAIPLQINVKCDPDLALSLREQYSSVTPGYHMNKKHWNTVVANGDAPFSIIKEWIQHSYDLVVAGLPKKERW